MNPRRWRESRLVFLAVAALLLPEAVTAEIIVAGSGQLLVDLRATDVGAGDVTWNNPGTLGDFVRIGNPKLELIDGQVAVTFDGNDAYQGPLAPAAFRTGPARTIEVWAYNPTVDLGLETMVAMGHRGGPCGANLAFGFGNDYRWGAVGAWCDPDLGWVNDPAGGSPPTGQWRHLVYTYTYEAASSSSTVRVYDNGVLMNSETVSLQQIPNAGSINLAAQNLNASGIPSSLWLAGENGSLSLANVRIHDGALTAEQVLNNFDEGIQAAAPSELMFTHQTLSATPLDADVAVGVVLPAGCNASQDVTVTVQSSAPNVARPSGSQGTLALVFTAGGATAALVGIDLGEPGQAELTLTSDKGCPTGPLSTLSVTVHAPQSVDLRVTTYDILQAGQIEQLVATGDFAPVGTRDVTAAETGTTYTVQPGGVIGVSPDGLVTAMATGQATVTATNRGVSSAPLTIQVVTPAAGPIAVAGSGILLVDLKATDPTAGTALWHNPGSLSDFRVALGTPALEIIAGEPAVSLYGSAYQGPLAPDVLRSGPGRSIEVWAYNPAINASLETMVAWGHRGGNPCGSNLAFGFGNHATWGAVGAWCEPDMPWFVGGGSPPLGEWRHLVYTYAFDAGSNSSTVKLYDNGVMTNSEVTGYQLVVHPGPINLARENLTEAFNNLAPDDPGTLSLANVRVHDGTLTDEQVLQNFNAGVQRLSAVEMTLTPRTLIAAVVDADGSAVLDIPAACNASRAINVTMTSDNPAVARPAGSGGASVVSFTAGGPTTQLVPIDFVGAGQASFTLASDGPCPTGPNSTLDVTVYAATTIELQVDYDVVPVGRVQQASVLADFGPAGTRDVAAAALGTTYSVDPAGILSVNQDGEITAAALGTATLTATHAGLTSQQVISVVTPGNPRLRIAGSGILLVDLQATDPTAGQAVWQNKGSLGDFTVAAGQPLLETVVDESAVTFTGDDAYQGPLAPPELRGTQARSIEVWALNPTVDLGLETMVAWGHRGGPCGSNLAFAFGNSGEWGAVGGWCPNGDLGWNDLGGSPPAGQWRHLVYTYDPEDNTGTTRLYDNGVQANTEISGAMPTNPGHMNLGMQNLGPNPLDLWLDGEAGSLSLAVVRVHDGALTAADVEFNFRLGITGRGQVLADLDLDGDVDPSDYVLFTQCAQGPAIPLPQECRLVDFDDDGDGDQDDFAILQRCYSGENVPATPGCN